MHPYCETSGFKSWSISVKLTSKLVFPLMWLWTSAISLSTAAASLSTIFKFSSMTAVVATSSASRLSSTESFSLSRNWTRAPTSASILSLSLFFLIWRTEIQGIRMKMSTVHPMFVHQSNCQTGIKCGSWRQKNEIKNTCDVNYI